jgi:hypothetical protein
MSTRPGWPALVLEMESTPSKRQRGPQPRTTLPFAGYTQRVLVTGPHMNDEYMLRLTRADRGPRRGIRFYGTLAAKGRSTDVVVTGPEYNNLLKGRPALTFINNRSYGLSPVK